MEYHIDVIFVSPASSNVFTISDTIGEDDWTCLNYWDDISEYMSQMICDAETMLGKLYPEGHDYSLSEVNIKHIGDFEE